MKMIKNTLFILFSILVLSSCEDFLDKPIKGKQLVSNYYSNIDEIESAVLGSYATLSPQDWWENDFFYLVGDICSDDAFKGNSIEGDQRDFGNLAQFNITPQNEWLDIKWKYMYQGIYRTNLIINRVPDAPVSEELKSKYIAEAKFLRAFFYFELVKNFGGVPLTTTPRTISDEPLDRATESDIWSQIEKDLMEAIPNLPLKSEQPLEEQGRATKGAAQAFLAKAALYQNNWPDAETYANQVVSSGEYNLNDSFDQVWAVNNPNGNGSIFEIQNQYSETFDAGSALPTVTGSRADGGWGFCTPSSHLENFMAGDPRLEHTIIKEGQYVDEEHPEFDTRPSENESGRINRKYYLSFADRADQEAHKRSPLNHILMRYADLLLIHAEACSQQGKDELARASLNAVRARVGLPEITLGGADLLNAIYNERRMELALEGHRYYDLKRTGKLEAAIADFVDYNMNRSTDQYDANNDKGVLFDPNKHYVFPIPQSEIDLSEGLLDQNPNY